MAQLAALRSRVTAGRVEEYFATHRADFDTVSFAQFAVGNADQARRLVDDIRYGAIDFHAAAERSFLDGGATAGDLFASVNRGKVPAELVAALDAGPGEVVGPIQRGGAFVIVRVLSKTPARLDEPTRAAVQEVLFGQWLDMRRSAAAIEWYWGPADHATGPSVTGVH